MAYGPPICAGCGSSDGVQEHHLVPRVHDGLTLPTVWPCYVCHGLVHGRKFSAHHRALTMAGFAAAKARGTKLGGYRGVPPPDATKAAAGRVAKADAFAARVGPLAQELQASGMALEAIARELTARGVKTACGGAWTGTAVKNLLAKEVRA